MYQSLTFTVSYFPSVVVFFLLGSIFVSYVGFCVYLVGAYVFS